MSNSIRMDLKRMITGRNKVSIAEGDFGALSNAWKEWKGRRLKFRVGAREVVLDVDMNWESFVEQWSRDVNGGAGSPPPIKATVVVSEAPPVSVSPIGQELRDNCLEWGTDHCVFAPVLKRLTESLYRTKSESVKKRTNQRINKMKELAREYDAGVPWDKLEECAVKSGYKWVIHDILGGVINTYNKKSTDVIRYYNVRPNHLDTSCIVMNDEFKFISKDAMRQKFQENKEDWLTDKIFYMYSGNIDDGAPRTLYTIEGNYCVKSSTKDEMSGFNKKIGLNDVKLNALKYPRVNRFLKDGRRINSCPTMLWDGIADGHRDMPKAYTQFKKCHMYDGFLGAIHQWRTGGFSCGFVSEHIGFWGCRVLSVEDELLGKLGLVKGMNLILFGPELLYYISLGCEFDITCGVWGSKFHFEFPAEWVSDREDKIYAKWSGMLSSEHPTTILHFPCSPEWASHLKKDHPSVMLWDDEATVDIPAEHMLTAHHLLGGITSYLRIQMIEAMKEFPVGSITKVVMDGIYFKGDVPTKVKWFKEKELKDHPTFRPWFEECDIDVDWSIHKYSGNTLLTGQGGCGKTYSLMTDNGLNDILFVSPSHILGQAVKAEFDVPYTTFHKLMGLDYVEIVNGVEVAKKVVPFYKDEYVPKVIAIDEITQYNGEDVEKVFAMYPTSLIFLMGDIDSAGRWFQCSIGKVWKPSGVSVIDMPGDRRSDVGDKLIDFKLEVRDVMRRVFDSGEASRSSMMLEWVRKNCKIIPFDSAVEMFKGKGMYSIFGAGDTWIAGTHLTNDKLLSKGIVSGFYKKGGYISDTEIDGYDKRGSFTIHSYQGKTIRDGKIFITISDSFEYAMFYTAISRAVRFSQLVFVE